jgi:hypothetical protein
LIQDSRPGVSGSVVRRGVANASTALMRPQTLGSIKAGSVLDPF